MWLTRSLLLGVVFALVALWLFQTDSVPASPSPNPTLIATLASFDEVPTLSTLGRGEFRAKIIRSVIEFKLTYRNLEGGAPTVAHIHLGRNGVNGGVIAFLCGSETTRPCPATGTITGILQAGDVVGPIAQGLGEGEFAEAVRAMLDGAAYVNVHTNGFRQGEIRGQIVPERP